MKKKKIFKIIIIIIIVVLILLFFNGLRNFIIISNLQNKLQDKLDADNVYSKIEFTENNTKVEQYTKDNNYKYIIDDGLIKLMTYKIDNTVTRFIDNGFEKIMSIIQNSDNEMNFVTMMDFLNTDTLFEKIINSIASFIKTEKVNNKDCYLIITKGLYSNYMYSGDVDIMKIYINKETGLPVQCIEVYDYSRKEQNVIYYEYQFGSVTDKDLEFPNISEYRNESEEISDIDFEEYPDSIDKDIFTWLTGDISIVNNYKDETMYKLMRNTLYSFSQKYENVSNCPFSNRYFNILGIGDSTEIADWTSNYAVYCYPNNKDNDLSSKYTKEITYDISIFNEKYKEGYYNLNDQTKSQYNQLNKNKEYYFYIDKLAIMNGNNKSKEEYINNSRAKKIKVTVNNSKEYIFELNDTNKVQIFDIDYKQNSIKTPVHFKIEVLETYKGKETEDIYISDIQFSIASNIPQGR